MHWPFCSAVVHLSCWLALELHGLAILIIKNKCGCIILHCIKINAHSIVGHGSIARWLNERAAAERTFCSFQVFDFELAIFTVHELLPLRVFLLNVTYFVSTDMPVY